MPLDADAISRLYEAHAGTMLGFFMRRTYEPEAAVDLLAETFAAAFEDRDRFRGSGGEPGPVGPGGPPRPLCRRRPQTTVSCCGKEPWW
jgi:hypothetical protein